MLEKKRDYYKIPRPIRSSWDEKDHRLFNDLSRFVGEYNGKSIYETVGFKVLGPILYGYTIWLRRKAKEVKADTIVFLSREGKILETAYKSIYGDKTDIRTEYINVSRLSLSKATFINTSSWDEFENKYTPLFRGLKSIGQLLDLFEIDVPNDALKEYGIELEMCLSQIRDKDLIYKLINDYGRGYGDEQKKLALRYLSSKGIGNGTTIISDIGWSGTMQVYLQELFPEERFVGCYIAINNVYNYEMYQHIEKYGFWADTDDGYRWKLIRFTMGAFECLFLNNEGTTVSYIDTDNMCLADNEVNVQPVKIFEKNTSGILIDKLHDAAIHCVEALHRDMDDGKGINNDIWFIPYINFAVYPRKDAVEIFKGVTFINGATEYNLIPTRSLIYYAFHPKDALKELELNNCKTLWFYTLIPFAIPYFDLLCFMTDKLKMKSDYEKRYLNVGEQR